MKYNKSKAFKEFKEKECSVNMKFDYHIIVIGAGSAGLVVASGSAGLGAKVALIEEEKMGGDCLNTGCVPSKSFLKCAHLAKDIKESNQFGLTAHLDKVELKKIMDRVRSVVKEIEPHDSKERYEGLGVEVFLGKAKISNKHTVEVGKKKLTGKYIVIATGSTPSIPNIKGLKEVPFLTNKNIFELEKRPSHLIVLGAGPIGLELGQGFSHLGSKVTIIDKSTNLFSKDDPEVAPIMEKKFLDDGIDLLLGSDILEIKKGGDAHIVVIIEHNGKTKEIKGDNLLVALGRVPSTIGLGLGSMGIQLDERGFVVTDKKLRTNIKNIFACGDVTGPYLFTHMAGYQAGIVIRNTIFRLGAKVDYVAVPWTTYTKPEVSHVGYTEPQAKSLGLFRESVLAELKDNDRAKAENDVLGFLKLIIGKKGQIIGATLVGEKAGEMIPVATLAIKQKLRATDFLGMIFSYPTEAEIFAAASLKKAKNAFGDWQKKLVKMIFLR
jgi:pyruvate/2-oxoglutarate dehydrogenase complex dihydrolipoamide dehydrogenase (E3) component